MAINPNNLEVASLLRIEPAGAGLNRNFQDISLAVEVTDTTPWYDRDYSSIDRIGFRAQLVGVAADHDPGPKKLGDFGLTVHYREMRCRNVLDGGRLEFRCEIVPVTRVRTDHEFSLSWVDDTRIVLSRSVGMTVDVALLDVDPAIERPLVGGREPQAEKIYARVQVIDLEAEDGDLYLKKVESNLVPGFAEFGDFGAGFATAAL